MATALGDAELASTLCGLSLSKGGFAVGSGQAGFDPHTTVAATTFAGLSDPAVFWKSETMLGVGTEEWENPGIPTS